MLRIFFMFVTWLCYCGNLGYFLVDAEHFLDFSAVSKVLLLYSFFAGALADKYGCKRFMVLPIIGKLVSDVGMIINYAFITKVPKPLVTRYQSMKILGRKHALIFLLSGTQCFSWLETWPHFAFINSISYTYI